MRQHSIAASLALLLLPVGASAADGTVASEQDLVNATVTCMKVIEADEPTDVLEVAEGDGWTLEKTTPIGGVLGNAHKTLTMKIERILFNRVCTILGNREETLSFAELSTAAEAVLYQVYGDSVGRNEERIEPNVTVRNIGKAVFTRQQSADAFNTQITVIDAD